ncbi:MAG: flagellar motor switch protein FliN [Spirochaetes bacterium]|nr:flagellar motor switch protein FliN [Spirochaetota bacterium]
MSDGALSQAEIDALLSGSSSADSGGGAATAVAGGSEKDHAALEGFFSSVTAGLAGNISSLTGATASLTGPTASFDSRDNFLTQLPDTVTVITADFTSGFPGEHLFIVSEDTAKAIAALITKEDDISLGDMAMSVIGELGGNLVGTQITAMTGKTGNKSIANAPPSAVNISKAAAALPAGDFAVMAYQLDLGDGASLPLWEVLGPAVASELAQSLTGGEKPAASGQAPGMGMPGMGMQMSGGMGMQQNLGPTNMQAVQFNNLMPPKLSPQESGNIGLIMDVSMEMTVELGRTRKLIKEILSMGEGTIIELDKLAGEPVDILVNHKLIAKGEVVVIDENFGVRVTEIVSPMDRFSGSF